MALTGLFDPSSLDSGAANPSNSTVWSVWPTPDWPGGVKFRGLRQPAERGPFLAVPLSASPTILTLACWACGAKPQPWERKRTRAHQIGERTDVLTKSVSKKPDTELAVGQAYLGQQPPAPILPKVKPSTVEAPNLKHENPNL